MKKLIIGLIAVLTLTAVYFLCSDCCGPEECKPNCCKSSKAEVETDEKAATTYKMK